MKRALSILLILVLFSGMIPTSFAVSEEANDAADTLYELRLFKGTGYNPDGSPIYALDRGATRLEAVTMLVRLLGKEEEALAGNWKTPFTDVADWAKPYVGYAYAHGLTKGGTDSSGKPFFDGDTMILATQYLTFVLRALGYESGTDFRWDAAWELSDRLGITNGEYKAPLQFDRSDMVLISAQALPVTQKDGSGTLADRLIAEGVFTKEQYQAAMGKTDAPFTETAFGNKALHEFLIGLNPTWTSLNGSFDQYRYDGADHAQQIKAEVERLFPDHESTHPLENGGRWPYFTGTWIRLYRDARRGCVISIQTVSETHVSSAVDYYINLPGEMRIPLVQTPAFGEAELNEKMLTLSPNLSYPAGGEGHWYIIWSGEDVYRQACAILNRSGIDFAMTGEYEQTGSSMGYGTRIEIMDSAQYGYSYRVELFHADGSGLTAEYYIRTVN